MHKNKQCKGFSILELSISVAIIALLVAAVTAGQNIKHRLQLSQVIDDLGLLNGAATSFESTNGGLAGDLYNAESQLGEANVGNKTIDGDDDGNGNGNEILEDDLSSPDRNENLLFFQHLAAAGLISGTFDGTTIGEGGLYEASLKNTYFFPDTDDDDDNRLFFLVSRVLSEAVGNGIFTTKEAYDFDTKYDDGAPLTGTIRGLDGTDQTAHDCITEDDSYNLSNAEENACALRFYVE